jgi:hypothetical protein
LDLEAFQAAALLHDSAKEPLRVSCQPPFLTLLALRGLRQPHLAGGALCNDTDTRLHTREAMVERNVEGLRPFQGTFPRSKAEASVADSVLPLLLGARTGQAHSRGARTLSAADEDAGCSTPLPAAATSAYTFGHPTPGLLAGFPVPAGGRPLLERRKPQAAGVVA